MYFSATDNFNSEAYSLWRSDGTPEGTYIVKSFEAAEGAIVTPPSLLPLDTQRKYAFELDLSVLSSGVYFLQFRRAQGTFVKRLQIC